jgi:hypothetical protein
MLLTRIGSLVAALAAVLVIGLPASAQGNPPSRPTSSAQPTATIGTPAQLVGRPTPTVQPSTAAPDADTTPVNAPPDASADASEFVPFWVAAFQPTSLWSDEGSTAQSLGPATVDGPLQVRQPQSGPRLSVYDPVSQTNAWIDATAVGTIGTPTADELAALANQSPSAAFEPFWVMTDQPTSLWSSPDPAATALAAIPQWRYFQVVQLPQGTRAAVLDPRTRTSGWLDLGKVGPVGAPPTEYLQSPPPDDQTLNKPARILGNADLFDHPARADYFALGRMKTNDAIIVVGAVNRPDGTWYHLDNGEYAPAANVRLPDPPAQTFAGRWIDATLTEPVIVTAYEGSTPVYAALAVKGTTAFETPTGVFHIQWRVADETMNSETLSPPIPRDGPGGYYLEHVLDTQYFTGDGASIHYNYWYANWGYAGSHGCLGMNLTDATFFWNFATVGTTVSIHN